MTTPRIMSPSDFDEDLQSIIYDFLNDIYDEYLESNQMNIVQYNDDDHIIIEKTGTALKIIFVNSKNKHHLSDFDLDHEIGNIFKHTKYKRRKSIKIFLI